MQNNYLSVNEIFYSIQGESTWAGYPCVFVRLCGCPLRCAYCDTQYAYDEGGDRPIHEITQECIQYNCSLVEITGGEPLAQAGCLPLAEQLLSAGKTVLVETSGAFPIHMLPEQVVKILDVKCPGSGMSDRMYWGNMDMLSSHDEVKFVITDRADFEWSCAVMERYTLPERCRQVLFSPVSPQNEDGLSPHQLAEWMLQDHVPARLQLPLHKYIWPTIQRGV